MTKGTFRALMMRESEGGLRVGVEQVPMADLGAVQSGEVVVRVSHSSLNYKDAMIVCGNRDRLVRTFPHIPGIDFAGEVVESDDSRYGVGGGVLMTGWRVGENRWGGFGEYARVPGNFLVPLPVGVSAAAAMAFGTAGFTAGMCVDYLRERGMAPDGGPVVVTGAGGGVGSTGVMLLHRLGYSVEAATGRAELGDWLKELGAERVIDREEVSAAGPPLTSERWLAALDTVGGAVLPRVVAGLKRNGVALVCGVAGGAKLSGATVLPFVLRGVQLVGVDSVMCPMEVRQRVWSLLAETLDVERVLGMCREIALEEVEAHSRALLDGQIRGRLIVRH